MGTEPALVVRAKRNGEPLSFNLSSDARTGDLLALLAAAVLGLILSSRRAYHGPIQPGGER